MTHKVYFNKVTNHTIIDVSGVKPLEKIKEEFGDFDYQEVEINEKEETFTVDETKKLKKVKLDKKNIV